MKKTHRSIIKHVTFFLFFTLLFIVGSFYLPHNFRGLMFYGILFAIDWLIMRVAFPQFNIKKRWQSFILIIHWLPLTLLALIVVAGIFIPFPNWVCWIKKTVILLTISGIVAQMVFFLFILIYLFLRIFFKHFQPLRWILYTGLGTMAVVFCLFITSPLWTLSPKVTHVDIPIQNLPKNFDNYIIVQISDLHLDYASHRFIQKSIDKINAEQPNLIAMTGDMVTFKAQEMNPYMQQLQQIQSTDGIFCIMGNHDYGSYAFETGSNAYVQNLNELQQNYQKLNWQLLNNTFKYLIKNTDTLIIAGTENQSLKKMFQSYGDIHKTLDGISGNHLIILLTHDPNYWTKEIHQMNAPIALTLSGHTHGMQIGMDTKYCRWSLYQLMSNYWGGLYQKNNKYLYINLGLGQTAFPGRIGLRPEITVFHLKRT